MLQQRHHLPLARPGGQDANYSINPMSYTKLDGSGGVLSASATSWVMVKDNVTGLIWENKTDDGTILSAPMIGSNSIDAIDVVKITDMSGSLPDSGGAVTVRAWDRRRQGAFSGRICLAIIYYQSWNDQHLGPESRGQIP